MNVNGLRVDNDRLADFRLPDGRFDSRFAQPAHENALSGIAAADRNTVRSKKQRERTHTHTADPDKENTAKKAFWETKHIVFYAKIVFLVFFQLQIRKNLRKYRKTLAMLGKKC